MAQPALLPLPAYTPSSLHPLLPPTVPSLLPSPSAPPPKRADVLSLKHRLAALLHSNGGASGGDRAELYWEALSAFVLGRCTRGELDEAMRRSFPSRVRGEAIKLHNALLLSILYNTTRPYVPPSSVRHPGFTPRGAGGAVRKRPAGGEGGGGEQDEASEKRRKLLKARVMALGRRERADLKLLGSAAASSSALLPSSAVATGKKKAAAEEEERRRVGLRREQERISEATVGGGRGGAGEIEPDGLPRRLREKERGEGAVLPSTLAQDFKRLAQTPLCCESRVLPDGEGMFDRLLLVAYEEGLVDGVEGKAAGLLQGAIDNHLTNMIASVLSLVRGTRQAVPSSLLPSFTSSSSSSSRPASAAPSAASTPLPSSTSTFAPAGSAPAAPTISISISAEGEELSKPEQQQLLQDDEQDRELEVEPVLPPPRPPLTIGDFHALFAISPHLLGQHPNSGAVERMYAIPPPESESESDSDEEEEEEEEGERAVAQARTKEEREAGEGKRDKEGDTEMFEAAPPNSASASKKPIQHPAVASLLPSSTPVLPSSSSSSIAGTGQGAGKAPRLSRSRASSFYGATRPVPVSVPSSSSTLPPPSSSGPGGAATRLDSLPRFVLDPTSTHGIPVGHPDVPPLPSTPQPLSFVHPSHAPSYAASSTQAPQTGTGGGAALSPKSLSLRNALFPELASSSAAATPAPGGGAGTPVPGAGGGDGNGTTDAGESDSEDEGATPQPPSRAGAGLKVKLNQSTVGPSGGGQGGTGQGQQTTTNEKDREAGRKLWEVVDSVGLLEGVLQ